jgi:nucleotide-binding universal stress UspA family protein
MFRKLLVPYDDTAQSAVALPVARAVARATEAAIRLVRIVPPGAGHGERLRARDSLERVAAELSAGGVPVSIEVDQGDVPEQLLSAIQATDADLVVMSTHGRSGVARAIVGSVAERLVQHSPVPVLVVRPGGTRVTSLRTLLVPVDGTPGGALALAAATGLARATSARIVLLQVAVPVPMWLFASEFSGALAVPIESTWDEDALTSAQNNVDRLARKLGNAGFQAEGRAVAGDPAASIVSAATEIGADLIVMSTRSLVGPARALLGSTADAVVRTAPTPVLLVRRDAGLTADGVAPDRAQVLAPTTDGS